MRKKKTTKTPEPGKKPANLAKVVKYLPPWDTGVAGPIVGEVEVDPRQLYNFDHIREDVKAIRRAFAVEYVKDFNGQDALLRLGLNYDQPRAVASRWLKEPYTQFILDQFLNEAKEDALISRNKIIAGLVREAHGFGMDCSGASRVSAFGKLAKILGLEIDRSEVNVRVAHGVMFVPLAESPEAWERNAKKSQSNLKQAAVA